MSIRSLVDGRLSRLARAARTRIGGAPARDPNQQLDSLTAVPNLFTLQAIRAAVTLGLPDLVDQGVDDTTALAAATDTNPAALARLLRHLVHKGVFAEPGPGRVSLTEVGRLLTSSHQDGRALYFRLDATPSLLEAVARELIYSIRTGLPAWSQVHDESLWELVAHNPAAAASFDRDMLDRARRLAPALAAGYDWDGVEVVADVGAGNGALIAELLTARSGLRGIIVEVAAAADRAQTMLADSGLLERCEIVAGSFFDPLPSGADVYLLSWVLHDWGDEDALRILERCREAAGASGRVLVIEKPSDVIPATELDLRMLVFFGGQERTRTEYEELARRARFGTFRWIPLSSDSWILECR